MDDLLDTAPCGFLSIRTDGTIAEVNTTLAEMLGHSRAELTGQHIDAILPVASRIFYNTHIFPMVQVTGRIDEVYFTLRTASGAVIPILANAARRRNGSPDVFDCVVMPMHERHKLETELILSREAAEDAGKAKGSFLSTLSHDLRTPLTSVLGYAELLLRGTRGELSPAQRRYVERIRDAGTYQLDLIDDILGYARLDAGREEFDIGTVDLRQALAAAEGLLAIRADEAGVSLTVVPAAADHVVRADPRRLQQVLLNLGTNAVKFTPAGGSVRIWSELLDGRVVVHVRDTGVGIPREQQGAIFEPFVQLPHTDGGSGRRGVGLGLAISRGLARGMGGDLTLDSTVGVGSTFSVTLPRA